MTSAPARAWLSDWRTSAATDLVVEDAEVVAVLADQPVVAVAGIGVERDVGDEADLRELLLDRAAGAANEIALVVGLSAVLVLQMRLGVGEEGDRRNVELYGALGLPHRLIDAEPIDARHRRDRSAHPLALDQEQGPDEIVGRQHPLADQAARPLRLAVAAGPVGEVETMGFSDAGRLVHGGADSSPLSYTASGREREGPESSSRSRAETAATRFATTSSRRRQSDSSIAKGPRANTSGAPGAMGLRRTCRPRTS